MQLTAVLTPAEEGGYMSYSAEIGTRSHSDTREEALASLHEVVGLDLSGFPVELTFRRL